MVCDVVDKYFLAFNALFENEKTAKDYGSGELLFHAEINLLDAIHKYPESNAIQLSKILDVTRGAITQWGNKLEEKGFIQRSLKEGNKKEKYYTLTEQGELIRKGHEEYHDEANKEICRYLSELKDSERNAILGFLEKVAFFPVSKFECRSRCCYAQRE